MDGNMVDRSKAGLLCVPYDTDTVVDMPSDALFILLVGKDAAFMRLVDDRFYNRFLCILLDVSLLRHPDVSTLLFLRKMKMELNLPVLGLVDSHPSGLNILSLYGVDFWLGFRPSDLNRYALPENCRLPMTIRDVKIVKEDFVMKNPGWVEEANLMLKATQKAELEALCTFGFQ